MATFDDSDFVPDAPVQAASSKASKSKAKAAAFDASDFVPDAPAAPAVAPIAQQAPVQPATPGATEPVYDPMSGLQVGTAPASGAQTINPAARAGIIGGGMGLTAGLATYPVAATAWAVDNGKQLLKGQGLNGVSMADALKYTRDEINDTRQNNPVAYGAGNVVGSAVGAGKLGALAKGAGLGSTAATIASGAIQGGAQGYSQNGNASDAAAGAGIGGIFGALGTGGTALMRKVSQADITQKALALIKQGVPANDLGPALDGLWADAKASDVAAAMRNIQQYAPGAAHAIWEHLRTLPGEIIGGGAVGAAGAAATGNDPYKGAAAGAAGVVGLSKARASNVVLPAISQWAATHPGAVQAGVTAGVGAGNATVTPDFSTEIGARLRALADRMRGN